MQLTNGRLIVPLYAGKPNGQTICYSDDHGATWKVAHTDGQDATVRFIYKSSHSSVENQAILLLISNDDYPKEGEVVELFPPKDTAALVPPADPTILYLVRAILCLQMDPRTAVIDGV